MNLDATKARVASDDWTAGTLQVAKQQPSGAVLRQAQDERKGGSAITFLYPFVVSRSNAGFAWRSNHAQEGPNTFLRDDLEYLPRIVHDIELSLVVFTECRDLVVRVEQFLLLDHGRSVVP